MDETSSQVATLVPPATHPDTQRPQPGSPSIARTLLTGASWSAVAQLLPVVLALILTPFLIHHLGLERYGLYVLCLTVVGYLRTFDGGLGATSLRYFSIHAGRDARAETTRLLCTLVAVVFVVGCAVVVAFAALAPTIVRAFGASVASRPDGVFLLRVFAAVAVFSLIGGLFSAVLVARQRFALQSLTAVTSATLGFIASIIFVSRGDGIRALAIVLTVQSLAGLLVIVPASLGFLDRNAVGFVSRSELRGFFTMAWRVQIVSLSGLITLETDSVIVGVFRGPRSVGFYSVGANFATQLRQVVINGLGPITAQLGRSFGQRGQQAVGEFEALQRVWVIGVTAWCVAGIGSAYVGITTWLGPGFEITGVIATVLAVSNMINLWTGVTTAWLQTTGHAGIEARYATVGIAVNIVLTAALVVPFGLGGICVGTASGQIVASCYLLRLVRRGVAEPVRRFSREVPWCSGALSLTFTVVLEAVASSHLPQGVVGLTLAGLLTLPGTGVFAWRERGIFSVLRGARGN